MCKVLRELKGKSLVSYIIKDKDQQKEFLDFRKEEKE